MVDRPTPGIRQLRTRLLPELIYVAALPYLIFRLASPYMPAAYALLLAGIPPAIRLALGLLRQRHIDLLGIFSLLAIVIALFSGLVLKDTSLQLASGSLVTGVYGVLMLASLLTPRPLVLRLAESALVGNDPAQRERFRTRLQQRSGLRSSRCLAAPNLALREHTTSQAETSAWAGGFPTDTRNVPYSRLTQPKTHLWLG